MALCTAPPPAGRDEGEASGSTTWGNNPGEEIKTIGNVIRSENFSFLASPQKVFYIVRRNVLKNPLSVGNTPQGTCVRNTGRVLKGAWLV